MILFFAYRVALRIAMLLGFRLLWSLGTTQRYSRLTAAVVPSYLVSKLGAALDEFVLW